MLGYHKVSLEWLATRLDLGMWQRTQGRPWSTKIILVKAVIKLIIFFRGEQWICKSFSMFHHIPVVLIFFIFSFFLFSCLDAQKLDRIYFLKKLVWTCNLLLIMKFFPSVLIKVNQSVYIANRTYRFCWQSAIILVRETWLSALNH